MLSLLLIGMLTLVANICPTKAPIPPNPSLEVSPTPIEKGLPIGPSIISTPKAFFTVDILINNVANASNLVGVQFDLKYNNSLLAFNNIAEGPFMNQTWETNRANSWAPYNTWFGGFPQADYIRTGILILPSQQGYNWSKFPDTAGLSASQRTIASFTFESIKQEKYPWTDSCKLDIELITGYPVYFLNSTGSAIDYDPEVDGEYNITGARAPTIGIITPENGTISLATSMNLNFTLDGPVDWIGYSLDNNANVTITGNTTLTGLTYGLHTVVVYANDTTGNMGSSNETYFTTTFLGDLNGDGTIDVYDIVIVADAYGSHPGGPKWNKNADLEPDNIIDIFDIVYLGINFGSSYWVPKALMGHPGKNP